MHAACASMVQAFLDTPKTTIFNCRQHCQIIHCWEDCNAQESDSSINNNADNNPTNIHTTFQNTLILCPTLKRMKPLRINKTKYSFSVLAIFYVLATKLHAISSYKHETRKYPCSNRKPLLASFQVCCKHSNCTHNKYKQEFFSCLLIISPHVKKILTSINSCTRTGSFISTN